MCSTSENLKIFPSWRWMIKLPGIGRLPHGVLRRCCLWAARISLCVDNNLHERSTPFWLVLGIHGHTPWGDYFSAISEGVIVFPASPNVSEPPSRWFLHDLSKYWPSNSEALSSNSAKGMRHHWKWSLMRFIHSWYMDGTMFCTVLVSISGQGTVSGAQAWSPG